MFANLVVDRFLPVPGSLNPTAFKLSIQNYDSIFH